MNRWKKGALALVCVSLPLLIAATSGGFPSRPRFANVGINTTPGPVSGTPLNVAGYTGGSTIVVRGHTTGSAAAGHISFLESSGTTRGHVGDWSAGDVDIHLKATGASSRLQLTAADGYIQLEPGDAVTDGYGVRIMGGSDPTYGKLLLSGTDSTVANKTFQAFTTSGAASFLGYIGDNSATDNDITVNSSAAVKLVGTSVQANGSNVVTLASGGDITTAPTISGSAICRANGTGCPTSATLKYAAGRVTGSTGALLTGSTGVTSVTRTAAGNYDVNVTAAGFTNPPSCSGVTTSASCTLQCVVYGTDTPTASLVHLRTNDNAGDQDENFTFTCVGT